tara:strand:- start:9732 stop:10016 length:285 start_codon:yes stop_codon:yes gene_type:complete
MADVYKQGFINGNSPDQVLRNITRPRSFPALGMYRDGERMQAPLSKEQKESGQKFQEYESLLNKENKTDAEFKRLGQLANELNIFEKYEGKFNR